MDPNNVDLWLTLRYIRFRLRWSVFCSTVPTLKCYINIPSVTRPVLMSALPLAVSVWLRRIPGAHIWCTRTMTIAMRGNAGGDSPQDPHQQAHPPTQQQSTTGTGPATQPQQQTTSTCQNQGQSSPKTDSAPHSSQTTPDECGQGIVMMMMLKYSSWSERNINC